MKTALRVLVLVVFAVSLALPVFAQDATQQDNDSRAALYQKFLDGYKKGPDQQKLAYEAGKEYIAKYGALTDPDNQKIAEFVKKWINNYEAAVRDFNFRTAIDKGDFNHALTYGREILAADSENVRVNLLLARIGYAAVSKGDKAAAGETLNYVRRAAQLIESGKVADSWAPYANKDEALGFLRYMEGFLLVESQPDAAVKSLIRAAQSNSAASKEPSTYDGLAYLYTKEFQKAAAEYQRKFPEGTEITPEMKPEYDRLQVQLDKIKDRIIDAQARSVALMTKPEQQADKSKVMSKLTVIYKSRHNSEAGLKELIAGILSKPLMLPGQEPEPVAAPTTSTNTAPTGGNPQTSQAATPNGKGAATTPAKQDTTKPKTGNATNNSSPRPR
jgi:hypothetical protein